MSAAAAKEFLRKHEVRSCWRSSSISTVQRRPGRRPRWRRSQVEQRLQPEVGARRVRNYLKTLTMELTTIARACGQQDVHHLEREDLVALSVEAAAMARVPLAGTSWIPGFTAT
jgi:hypothetical protein